MTSLPHPVPPEKPLQLDDFCRICLLRKAQLRPLTTQIFGVMISEMLYKVTGTLINMQDQLPRVICDRCLIKVDLAISIVEEFRKQEEKLRRFWWKGGVLVDELVAYAQTEDSWRKTHSEEVIERLALERLETVPVVVGVTHAVKEKEPIEKPELDESALCIEIMSDDSAEEAVQESMVHNEIYNELEMTLNLEDAHVQPAESQDELLVKQQQPADYPSSPAESDPGQEDNDNDSDYVPDDDGDRDGELWPSSVASETGQIAVDDDSKSSVSSDGDVPKLQEGATTCPVCAKEFQTWLCLKRHHRRHVLLAKGKYKCKKCGHVAASKSELKAHKLSHINSGKANCFECRYCLMPFRYAPRLAAHEKIHKLRNDPVKKSSGQKQGGSKTKIFECRFCGMVFVWECRLRRHELTHEKRIRVKKDLKAKRKRMTNEMQGNKPFQCEHCSKSFWWKGDLNRHVRSHKEADAEGGYKCHKCDQTYEKESSLEKHLKGHEAVESGKFRCKYCDQAFASNYVLKRHMLRCVNKNDFPKLTRPITLVREGRSYFKCRDCGKMFDARISYFQHVQTHGVPRTESHQCPDCGRRFGQRANLRQHQQEVHGSFMKAEPKDETGATVLHCSECDTLFSTRESYETHLQGHHSQREPHTEEVVEQMDTDEPKLGAAFVVVDNVTTPLESVPEWQVQEGAFDSESLEATGVSIEILSDDSDDDVIELSEDDELEPASRPSTSCSESMSAEFWACTLCDTVMPSASKSAITNHMRMHQNILNGKFKCEVCDKKFGFSPDLEQHRRLIHNMKQPAPEDTVKCEYCNKQINRNKYPFHLSCHRNLELRNIVCEVCDKAFGSSHHLRWHRKSKTCQRAHQEDQLRPVLIQNRNTLQTPEQRHQDGLYKCTECGKSYANSQTISAHMQQHQAVKEGRFKCAICDLACLSELHLEAHMRIHPESVV